METKKFDRSKIMEYIPQRDPILLVDVVTELVPGESIKAEFYVSSEMDVLKGHFPDEPVLPGVYTVEAMAQASCILLLQIETYLGKTPYFIGINNVRFTKKILPGDTLEINSKILTERPEKAIATCTSEVYVEGEMVCSGEVVLALR